MKKTFTYLSGIMLLAMSSCSDMMDFQDAAAGSEDVLKFEASMAEQDWYGTVNTTTRAAGASLSEDRIYDTNLSDRKGNPYKILSHTVEGIDVNRSPIGQQQEVTDGTRAIVTKSIDTRSLSVTEVGYVIDKTNKTTQYVNLINRESKTQDGQVWTNNEFVAARSDYKSFRYFGALFPYSNSYKIHTDNYDNPGELATLGWAPYFRVDYTLASDSAHLQEDLLYAKFYREFEHTQNTADQNMPLAFRHAMTAVRLKLGSNGFVPAIIKEVRIKGVSKAGTLYFFDKPKMTSTIDDLVATGGRWEVDTKKTTDCVAKVNFDTQGESNCYVTGDAATFMMIPQTLPAGTKMEIDVVFAARPVYAVNDDGEWDPDVEEWDPDEEEEVEEKVVTMTCDLGGEVWEMGKTREYIITTKENVDGYYMSIDGINKAQRTKYIEAEGGEAKFSISSYKRNPKGSSQEYSPLAWKLIGWSYEEDADELNTTFPDWLKLTDSKGNVLKGGSGSVTGETINVKVGAQQVQSGVLHADILKGRPLKGSTTDGAYDLSRHEYGTGKDCETTTANCYVIDAAGHYSFPTIYGNALKDGKVNGLAYGRTDDMGDYQGTGFVDYLDRSILSPSIQYNTKLGRAVLLWQDVQDMVKNVRLVQRGDYVEFDIDRDHIDQGNAVIAVLDEQGRIVWSWHIWVTDEDIRQTVSMGNQYQAMPVNLGWKSTQKASAAPGRDIYLVFAQGENGDELSTYQTIVRLSQKSSYKKDEGDNMKGSSPYYQWGRKDPLLGAVNGKSIPAYTYYGQSFYTESVTTWTVSEAAVITEKIFLFAATAAVGIAAGICTAGMGTLVVAGAVAGGLVGSAGVSAAVNVGFAEMNKLFTTTDTWGVTLGYSIQHPTADFKSAMTWTDSKEHAPYHDLWGIGQRTDSIKKVVKTIYDPCPVGFHVPEGDAFNKVKGAAIGLNSGLTSGNLRLPACGGRADYIHDAQTQGNFDYYLMEVGKAGGYWTARPIRDIGAGFFANDDTAHDNERYRASEGAYRFLFGSAKDHFWDTADPSVSGAYEAWGLSVRPVKDY